MYTTNSPQSHETQAIQSRIGDALRVSSRSLSTTLSDGACFLLRQLEVILGVTRDISLVPHDVQYIERAIAMVVRNVLEHGKQFKI